MALSSLFTGPLFSTVITLYILILLYFPSPLIGIVFSPVLISTSVLLLSLLRLGAIQKENKIHDPITAEKNDIGREDCKWVSSVSEQVSYDNRETGGLYSNASFVEWDVRAPLEVIYEGHEEGDEVSEERRDAQMSIVERCASLSKFYPETDSDTSEDEDFPAIRRWDPSDEMGFRWEGEDRDGMIEIELDGRAYSDIEEDNLIEIDIRPAR